MLEKWQSHLSWLVLLLGTSINAHQALAAELEGWRFDPATAQLEITTAGSTTPQYFVLSSPLRIVLDLPDTQLGAVSTQQQSYEQGAVRQVRVAQFQPGVARIVLELSSDAVLQPRQVQLQQSAENRWLLKPLLTANGGSAAESAAAVSPRPIATPSSSPSATPPASSPSRGSSLLGGSVSMFPLERLNASPSLNSSSINPSPVPAAPVVSPPSATTAPASGSPRAMAREMVSVPPLSSIPNSSPSPSSPPVATPNQQGGPTNRPLQSERPSQMASQPASPSPLATGLNTSAAANPHLASTSRRTLRVRYAGAETLSIASGDTRPGSVQLAEPLLDQNGAVLAPQGTVLNGEFRPDQDGIRFVSQSYTINGKNVQLVAQSELLARVQNPQHNNNAGASGTGATGASSTYLAAPYINLVQPNQILDLKPVQAP
ncbi:AMIN domain-containing protein [Leptolyngbya sp. FACHB-261]|uniref:AMIN domain-containing protein n=1 Tax=Leptolyngbya sp. FACHB-261 TaxID=2692806 RepID=UPI001683E7FC|nr:AMIN domain-containing protein [Leptolyngbya sp. FACHB-261]